jgi:hypothetical protein
MPVCANAGADVSVAMSARAHKGRQSDEKNIASLPTLNGHYSRLQPPPRLATKADLRSKCAKCKRLIADRESRPKPGLFYNPKVSLG